MAGDRHGKHNTTTISFRVNSYEKATIEERVKVWTIVNKKDTIFKYIFWERLDSLPIPECCFHFVWCQIA